MKTNNLSILIMKITNYPSIMGPCLISRGLTPVSPDNYVSYLGKSLSEFFSVSEILTSYTH